MPPAGGWFRPEGQVFLGVLVPWRLAVSSTAEELYEVFLISSCKIAESALGGPRKQDAHLAFLVEC